MNQSKANLAFMLHKNIAFFVIMAIGILVVYFPPKGWNAMTVILFFVFSQVSFHWGVLTNMRFNGYGVAEQINRMAQATIVPDFGLTWHGFAVKPLARSWTVSLMLSLVFVAVAVFFLLFPQEAPIMNTIAPIILAYASAKLVALVGEVYVWMMADRHRHWYLVEGRLRKFLIDLNRPPKAIEVIIYRAQKAQLLTTINML